MTSLELITDILPSRVACVWCRLVEFEQLIVIESQGQHKEIEKGEVHVSMSGLLCVYVWYFSSGIYSSSFIRSNHVQVNVRT